MRHLKRVTTLLSLVCLLALSACGGGGGGSDGDNPSVPGPTPRPSSAKEIISYTVHGIAASIDQGTKSIVAVVPYGTDIAKSEVTYTTTGLSVTIGNAILLKSTETTTLDFTEAVTIKVRALDGSENVYTAKVIVAANTAKSIFSYSIKDHIAAPVSIDEVNGVISATLPYDAAKTELVANFTTSGERVQVGETIQETGLTANDFTNPVTYTVYAADGNTKDYAVAVTNATKDAKSIVSYGIKGYPAAPVSIDELNGKISVVLPYGVPLIALVAEFTTTGTAVKIGETIQKTRTTKNDFTKPVTYTVYAADGSTQNYTITITNAVEATNLITSYGIKNFSDALVNIDDVNSTISVTIPYHVSLTDLVANFTTNGERIQIGETVQETGLTANDFTNPVTYTVFAANGNTKSYSVTVTEKPTVTSYFPAGCKVGNKAAGIIGDCTCVQDTKTHDIWLANPDTGFKLWQEAVVWATALNDNGMCGIHDWGLPTKQQLDTMASYASNIKTNKSEWFNNNGFMNIDHTAFYWGLEANATEAWAMEMALLGGVYSVDKHIANGHAWAVYTPSVSYAYIPGGSSGKISMYRLDPASGELIPLANPSVGSDWPASITFEPKGRYAYVTNVMDNTISTYGLNSATGWLTPSSAPAVKTPQYPSSIAFDPTGRFAYVVNQKEGDSSISIYNINQETGELTAFSNIKLGSIPNKLIIDPAGRYAYLTTIDYNDYNIYSYSINQSTGELAEDQTLDNDGIGAVITFDPTGRYAYVINANSAIIYKHATDASGKLSKTPVNKFATGQAPQTIIFNSYNNTIYVATNSTVYSYTFNPTNGDLVALSSSNIQSTERAFAMTFNPYGNFAYIPNSNGIPNVYKVDLSTGTLTYKTTLNTDHADGLVFKKVSVSQ
jgi:6-phosphogluconolactonase (cycloisomerase 2 family)